MGKIESLPFINKIYQYKQRYMICEHENRAFCGAGTGKVLSVLLSLVVCMFICFFAEPLTAYSEERVYVAPAQAQSYPYQYVKPAPQPPKKYYRYKYQYSTPRNWYGQRRAVPNVYEAGRIMRQYFPGMTIGPIKDKDLFYQADVRDGRGVLVDKVILDKRTGRMRSIY
jgi:hypothetical protein